jgi:hypothetical protein
MSGSLLKTVRWAAIALMGAMALYQLLILAYITFANLTPKPWGLPLVWLVVISELPAVALALRYAWLPMVVGTFSWIVDVITFQLGEQHVGLATALQHSSLDFAFIFLAVVFFLTRATPSPGRAVRQ